MRIAIPNKGRLSEDARQLLDRAGLKAEFRHGRTLTAELGEGFEALFVRAADIPEFVADGAVDLGITGHDLVAERGADLHEVLDLGIGRCRLVVAFSERSSMRRVEDIEGPVRVATSFPNLTHAFFRERGIEVELAKMGGAVEIAPLAGVADVIVDLVATGSTLRLNGLVEGDVLLNSTARLVARPDIREDKSRWAQAEDLSVVLQSVLRAREKRYLMANVSREALPRVRELLPGLGGTTVVDLEGTDKVAAHAVIPATDVYRTVARLKAVGASGILVTQIERMVP